MGLPPAVNVSERDVRPAAGPIPRNKVPHVGTCDELHVAALRALVDERVRIT